MGTYYCHCHNFNRAINISRGGRGGRGMTMGSSGLFFWGGGFGGGGGGFGGGGGGEGVASEALAKVTSVVVVPAEAGSLFN